MDERTNILLFFDGKEQRSNQQRTNQQRTILFIRQRLNNDYPIYDGELR